MDHLEFTKHGFGKYETQDVESLLQVAGFKDVSTQTMMEPELEFDGVAFHMEGFYTTGIR